jgi:hypothetical protein
MTSSENPIWSVLLSARPALGKKYRRVGKMVFVEKEQRALHTTRRRRHRERVDQAQHRVHVRTQGPTA